jgi:hypothetical protein
LSYPAVALPLIELKLAFRIAGAPVVARPTSQSWMSLFRASTDRGPPSVYDQMPTEPARSTPVRQLRVTVTV